MTNIKRLFGFIPYLVEVYEKSGKELLKSFFYTLFGALVVLIGIFLGIKVNPNFLWVCLVPFIALYFYMHWNW